MTIRRSNPSLATALTAALASAGAASAGDPIEMPQVVFSDVGWTDISATTALASSVLQALGYETETKILSPAVTYTAMAKDDVDVFLATGCPARKTT